MITVTVLLNSFEKVQRFVDVISKYSCTFDIESGSACVNGKSILSIYSLDIFNPLHLSISESGPELEDILRDIAEFME